MCTVSWFQTEQGYELFFNRDERRTRLPAQAPRVHALEGVGVLAPTDGDAGGTWIAVNEFGLGLGLLNAWHVSIEATAAGFRSRGLLVRELASSTDLPALRLRLRELDTARYQGFTLLAFAPGAEPLSFAWDGSDLRESAPLPPVVSSSLDVARAAQHRRELFERLRVANGAPETRRARFEAFHRSQEPAPGPWAVCMRREDASTVSASHLEVTARAVRFRYAGGAPDETPFAEALELARAGVGS